MSIIKQTPEDVAKQIVTALTVHAFDNDADAGKALNDTVPALTRLLTRYVRTIQNGRKIPGLGAVRTPDTVTFTGIDPTANFDEVTLLSDEYPKIEWGILVGRRVDRPRYPNLNWIRSTAAWAHASNVNLAYHVCGEYARLALIDPNATLTTLLPLDIRPGRVQINAELPQRYDTRVLREWSDKHKCDVILQARGDAFPNDRNVRWLADQSGGTGRVRTAWPEHFLDRLVGYAGGISPANVLDVIRVLGARTGDYWIDMESSLFADDKFLVVRAREVCEKIFGPSASEVARLREGLVKIGNEIGPTRAYAEDMGLSSAYGGSPVHVKLSLIENYVTQALGLKELSDLRLTLSDQVEDPTSTPHDPNYIAAGSSVEAVQTIIDESRKNQ